MQRNLNINFYNASTQFTAVVLNVRKQVKTFIKRH